MLPEWFRILGFLRNRAPSRFLYRCILCSSTPLTGRDIPKCTHDQSNVGLRTQANFFLLVVPSLHDCSILYSRSWLELQLDTCTPCAVEEGLHACPRRASCFAPASNKATTTLEVSLVDMYPLNTLCFSLSLSITIPLWSEKIISALLRENVKLTNSTSENSASALCVSELDFLPHFRFSAPSLWIRGGSHGSQMTRSFHLVSELVRSSLPFIQFLSQLVPHNHYASEQCAGRQFSRVRAFQPLLKRTCTSLPTSVDITQRLNSS